MSKPKQTPPPVLQKPRRDPSAGRAPGPDPNHWSVCIRETVLSALPDDTFHVTLLGGADNGLFCYLDEVDHGKVTYHSGQLESDHIILEIQGQRIAGYTLRDAMVWLKQVSQNGAPVMIKSVKSGKTNLTLQLHIQKCFIPNSACL